jgi:hypothetical protein
MAEIKKDVFRAVVSHFSEMSIPQDVRAFVQNNLLGKDKCGELKALRDFLKVSHNELYRDTEYFFVWLKDEYPYPVFVPNSVIRKAYEPYKSFDGVKLWDYYELLGRYAEEWGEKRPVFELLKDIANGHDIQLDLLLSPSDIESMFNKDGKKVLKRKDEPTWFQTKFQTWFQTKFQSL